MALGRMVWPVLLRGLGLAGCVATGPDRYLVYFDEGSATISPQAQAVIADAASHASAGARSVRVEAHASRPGTPATNLNLSDARAAAVAAALARDGLAPTMIRKETLGASAAGDPSVADRRVDIVLER